MHKQLVTAAGNIMRLDLLRRHSNGDPIKRELHLLSKTLAKNYQRETKQLLTSRETLQETEALHLALQTLTQTRITIDRFLKTERVLNSNVLDLLFERRKKVIAIIESQKLDSRYRAGAVSVGIINELFFTETQIASLLLQETRGNDLETELLKRPLVSDFNNNKLVIASDALYQMHHSLFPAEKMLVASGKRNSGGIQTGAIFDVTGQGSSGHVLADPQKLGRALIAMDVSDTYFALWVHSHPGFGKGCTQPSTTDQRQHEDWLRDYSKDLVSAIMVEDRWIRFWGTALENGRVTVEVTGPGIFKEASNDTVFRLEC